MPLVVRAPLPVAPGRDSDAGDHYLPVRGPFASLRSLLFHQRRHGRPRRCVAQAPGESPCARRKHKLGATELTAYLVPPPPPLPRLALACTVAVLVVPQNPRYLQPGSMLPESNISVLVCTANQFADLKVDADAACASPGGMNEKIHLSVPELSGCAVAPVKIGERTEVSQTREGRCYFLVRFCSRNVDVEWPAEAYRATINYEFLNDNGAHLSCELLHNTQMHTCMLSVWTITSALWSVCICVCVCVCVCVGHTFIHTNIHTHTHTHTHTCMYMHIHTHTYTYTYTCTYTYTYTYTYNTHLPIHIHTHIHIYTGLHLTGYIGSRRCQYTRS